MYRNAPLSTNFFLTTRRLGFAATFLGAAFLAAGFFASVDAFLVVAEARVLVTDALVLVAGVLAAGNARAGVVMNVRRANSDGAGALRRTTAGRRRWVRKESMFIVLVDVDAGGRYS